MVGGLCGSMLESAGVSICITVTPAQELARKFGKDPRGKNTLHAVSLPVPAIASLLGHWRVWVIVLPWNSFVMIQTLDTGFHRAFFFILYLTIKQMWTNLCGLTETTERDPRMQIETRAWPEEFPFRLLICHVPETWDVATVVGTLHPLV